MTTEVVHWFELEGHEEIGCSGRLTLTREGALKNWTFSAQLNRTDDRELLDELQKAWQAGRPVELGMANESGEWHGPALVAELNLAPASCSAFFQGTGVLEGPWPA